jgi:hypothetical protein
LHLAAKKKKKSEMKHPQRCYYSSQWRFEPWGFSYCFKFIYLCTKCVIFERQLFKNKFRSVVLLWGELVATLGFYVLGNLSI